MITAPRSTYEFDALAQRLSGIAHLAKIAVGLTGERGARALASIGREINGLHWEIEAISERLK